MKYLRLVFVTMLALFAVAAINAQEEAIEFEAFASDTFGIEGLVPVAWQNAGPGVYVRAASASDLTSLVIQAAPMPGESLLAALSGQLGIEAFPESESEQVTDLGTWTVYLVELEVPVAVNVSVAITEIEGTSYIVLMQSAPVEHETLRESVFMPVIDSVAPLTVAEDEEESEPVPYIEEEITFMSGDLTLAGTLTIPEGEGEFPVVLLISGSGAQDRDEGLAPIAEIKPFRDIADYLTRNGIAVLRYDERGVGESEGDISSADIYILRDDASAAVDYLAERNEFSHIGIAGHSEGGAYAPEIAITNDNVDFVIGLAAPTVNMIDISREQGLVFHSARGASEERLEAMDAAYVDVIEAIQADDDEALRQAVTDLTTAQAGEELDEESIDLAVAQFQTPIFQSYIDYDPTPFWLDLDVPTLAIYGTLDTQVLPDQNIPVIYQMNDNISVVTIDNMNHIFQEAETGDFAEYGTLEQSVMPELLETMTAWILEITAD